MTLDLAKLKEAAEKATPGDWESDSERSDGCYGYGQDCHEGYQSFAVFVDGKKICDALNSDIGCVHEEHDEDGCYAWDDVAKRNMGYIALAKPATILALIERLESAEEIMNGFAHEQAEYVQNFQLDDPGYHHNIERARAYMEKHNG